MTNGQRSETGLQIKPVRYKSRRKRTHITSPSHSWLLRTYLRIQLVLKALDMALRQRLAYGMIHHSDQGSQYTSLAFGQRCQQAGVRPSLRWTPKFRQLAKVLDSAKFCLSFVKPLIERADNA
jgi:hypothetical protein